MENIQQFYIQRNLAWGDVFEIHGRVKNGNTSHIFAGPVLNLSTPGEFSPPFLRLERTEAQQLMDELWNAGVRPVGAAGSAGQLDAVKYHLEDMRKMVFNGKSSS